MSYSWNAGLGAVATAQQAELAQRAGIPLDVLLAIQRIESGANPRAVRFEPHVFHRKTGNRFVSVVPGAPGEVSRVREYTDRAAFERARRYDERAAIESTSWGLFQVLGGHLLRLYPSNPVSTFDSAPARVSAELLVSWFEGNQRAREAAQAYDIAELARRYNGSDRWRVRVTEALESIRREGVAVSPYVVDAAPFVGVGALVLAAGFAGWAFWRYRKSRRT